MVYLRMLKPFIEIDDFLLSENYKQLNMPQAVARHFLPPEAPLKWITLSPVD